MRYVKLRYRNYLYIFLYLIITVLFSFSSASEYYPTLLSENTWKEEDYYDALPPGDYLIDVIVDLIHLTKTIPLYVESKKNKGAVYYCLRKIDLVKAGIDFASIEEDRFESNKLSNNDCIEPQSMFDGVLFYIRHQDMTGYLKIPEKYQHTKSINRFSYGDPALFAEYDSYFFIDDSSFNNMDFNAGLQFGINHSRWQIRHNGSYSEGKYNHSRLYMRTYLEDISSQLLLGTISAKVG
ncbi:MAG: FimD/PapC N-terminal domain-containing protein, partial [Vagococcus fluvialis]